MVYWFWIWPILRSRPELHELYQQEESFFIALREKLKGIKQKLSSVLVIAASTWSVVTTFSHRLSAASTISSLTAQVPPWAWPLVLISLTALFQFLRNRMALLRVAGGGVGHLPGR